MSASVILSSDTHTAKFVTHGGNCSSEIPRIVASSDTSCVEPVQSDTNSKSISSSKKLTTFWRNGASNTSGSEPDISKVNGNATLKIRIRTKQFIILNPNHLSLYFEFQ